MSRVIILLEGKLEPTDFRQVLSASGTGELTRQAWEKNAEQKWDCFAGYRWEMYIDMYIYNILRVHNIVYI